MSATTVPRSRGRRVEPRPLGRGERIADAWVHAVGVAAGLVGVVALVAVAAPKGNTALTLSVIVYGVGLLAMLIASALYNGGGAARHKDLLRRIDHAAIFVMIAGTYTPLVAMKMDAAWSHWLLLYVWAVALAGVTLKLIWVNRFPRLSVGLYLFLGWTIVVAFEPLSASMSPLGLTLLVMGGVLYSVGVLFHLWERLPYQQPIWHAFVIAAAACHYAMVMGEVALPGSLG